MDKPTLCFSWHVSRWRKGVRLQKSMESRGIWWVCVDDSCLCLVTRVPFTLHMMTSSNGNIFRVTGPLCGEFTGPGEFTTQRPVTRSFDVFFSLRLNERLSKQPWGWWFETPSRPLWRQCFQKGRLASKEHGFIRMIKLTSILHAHKHTHT